MTVTILDVNDNTPFFIQDPLVIEVSSRRSQRVLATMKAEDKDFGANGSVFYRFATPVKGFSINSLTGEIQATEPLGELSQAQRTLIVEAMDQGTPAQSAQGVVVIYVKEVEYSGIRFSRNARDVSIQENALKGATLIQCFFKDWNHHLSRFVPLSAVTVEYIYFFSCLLKKFRHSCGSGAGSAPRWHTKRYQLQPLQWEQKAGLHHQLLIR